MEPHVHGDCLRYHRVQFACQTQLSKVFDAVSHNWMMVRSVCCKRQCGRSQPLRVGKTQPTSFMEQILAMQSTNIAAEDNARAVGERNSGATKRYSRGRSRSLRLCPTQGEKPVCTGRYPCYDRTGLETIFQNFLLDEQALSVADHTGCRVHSRGQAAMELFQLEAHPQKRDVRCHWRSSSWSGPNWPYPCMGGQMPYFVQNKTTANVIFHAVQSNTGFIFQITKTLGGIVDRTVSKCCLADI